MIDTIKRHIRTNRLAILWSILFVSSVVTPLMLNQLPYVAGLLFLGIYVVTNNKKTKAKLYVPFLIVLVVSSIINHAFNVRLIIFLFLILITSSIFSSQKIYKRKCVLYRELLYVIFVLNILNIGCYFLGINYYFAWGYATYFSGLTPHPMWLAVVCGIANIVNVYFLLGSKKKSERVALVVLIILTIYLQFTAGSRAGLLSTLVGVMFLLRTHYKNMIKVGVVTAIVGAGIYLAMPLLTRDAALLQSKIEEQDVENNSRTNLWDLRIQEIKHSPWFGIGFARTFDPDDTGNINEGRAETGSGWMAVWSQTGIFALLIMAGMLLTIYKKYNRAILPNKQIFISVFTFLCVHSFFEGYLYTTFYLPCFLFWLVLDILYEAPVGKVKRIQYNKRTETERERP